MVPRRWTASFALAATSAHFQRSLHCSALCSSAASTSAARTLTLILWVPASGEPSGSEGEIDGLGYVSVLAPSLGRFGPWIGRR